MNRKISKLNVETSALGMGCWAIGGEWNFCGTPAGWGRADNNESLKTLDAAYANGIRVYDTAAAYGAGLSEELVGKALRGKRDKCIISSKIGYNLIHGTKDVKIYQSPKEVISNLKYDAEACLRRLKMDYIDVLFLHVGDYDSHYAEELMHGMERLTDEGKIRSYGWSTDNVELAKLWEKGKGYSSVQINYNITVEAGDMMKLADSADLTMFNRGPLAMGYLTGKYNKDSKFSETDVRNAQWVQDMMKNPVLSKIDLLKEVLTSGGRTLTQGALAWIWRSNNRMLPIPGIRTVKQAEENAEAMEIGPLTESQFNQVEEIMGRA